MASSSKQTVSATTPHFFKVIVDDTSRDLKLVIPAKFMMKHGSDLSGLVRLKLPSGSNWEVEVTRSDGKAWFEKGWGDFSKLCSVEYGYFLVFRYQENSVFEVCVFDRTCTEIDYPTTASNIYEVEDEALMTCTRCKKMKTSSSISDKVYRDASVHDQPGPMVFTTEERNKESHCPTSEIKVKNKVPYVSKQVTQTINASKSNFVAAKKFVSENPSFLVTLGRFHREKYNMTLPARFAESFIKVGNHIVKLQVEDRSWHVKLISYYKHSAKFSGGWAAFAKEHNLEEGDVCVFELIESNQLVFKVHMFKC